MGGTRSTCQVMGPYAEQMVLSREVPAVEGISGDLLTPRRWSRDRRW